MAQSLLVLKIVAIQRIKDRKTEIFFICTGTYYISIRIKQIPLVHYIHDLGQAHSNRKHIVHSSNIRLIEYSVLYRDIMLSRRSRLHVQQRDQIVCVVNNVHGPTWSQNRHSFEEWEFASLSRNWGQRLDWGQKQRGALRAERITLFTTIDNI